MFFVVLCCFLLFLFVIYLVTNILFFFIFFPLNILLIFLYMKNILSNQTANVPLPKTVATLFREITGKKVFVAGSFQAHKGGHAVRSALKNSDGLLFPTRNTLIFIHKPTIFIKYRDIASIEFQRYDGSNGRSHTFDLCVSCRSIGGEAPREWVSRNKKKKQNTDGFLFLCSSNLYIYYQLTIFLILFLFSSFFALTDVFIY